MRADASFPLKGCARPNRPRAAEVCSGAAYGWIRGKPAGAGANRVARARGVPSREQIMTEEIVDVE